MGKTKVSYPLSCNWTLSQWASIPSKVLIFLTLFEQWATLKVLYDADDDLAIKIARHFLLNKRDKMYYSFLVILVEIYGSKITSRRYLTYWISHISYFHSLRKKLLFAYAFILKGKRKQFLKAICISAERKISGNNDHNILKVLEDSQ